MRKLAVAALLLSGCSTDALLATNFGLAVGLAASQRNTPRCPEGSAFELTTGRCERTPSCGDGCRVGEACQATWLGSRCVRVQ